MTTNVHNHGPDDGRGIGCGESRLADGSLIGWCQLLPVFYGAKEQAWTGDDPPATNPHTEEIVTDYIFTFEDDVEPFARIEGNHEGATATTPYRHFPKMEVTEDGLSASFDLTSMVHGLAQKVMKRVEEGAVGEVVAFLAANGHLDDVIRKAKDEAWQEGLLSAGLDLDYTLQIMGTNPYAEEP